MDPHRNIFYYYSGGKKKEDQIVYDRQLENNTTKTLINILENTDDEIADRFISVLLKVKSQPGTEYHYGLQRKPFVSDEAKVKVLVCISPDKKVSGKDGSPGGIPDAWIYDLKGRIVVAVESKIKGGVSDSQIKGHLKSLNWKPSAAKIVHLSWVDVYSFLNKTLEKSEKISDKRFLMQGIEYLEYIGMDKFNGFKNEDFDYFSAPNSDYKPILKRKIERFTDLLKQRIDPSLKNEYKDFYIGNLGLSSKEWAWMAIKRMGNKKDPFLQCNFTVEIKSEGLEVNTVFRNGRHTDEKKPIGFLYTKVDEQFSDFRNILKKLGSGAYIELFERTNRQGGRPMSGNEIWSLVLSLELGHLTNEAISHLQSLMREIDFPGIHIGYRIRRGSKILSDPEKLFDQINKRLVDLKPTLDFILDEKEGDKGRGHSPKSSG